jgi:site-specific recombinase XerD
MLSVHFFLRNVEKSTNDDAELTIYCILGFESAKRDTPFSTKITVPKRYWWTNTTQESAQDNWVHPDYYQAESINVRLREITRKIHSIYDVIELLYPDEQITYSHIRRHYDPDSVKIVKAIEPKVSPTIEQIYLEFLEEKQRRIGIKELTQKSYRSRINNIYAFFGRSKRINAIRHKDLDMFEQWLIEQKNELGEPRFCRNYRNKHLTLVYDLVGFAVKKDYLQAMPLVALELRYDPIKPPQYLLPEQREALMAVDVPSLRKAQDIAQFLMHTGFSWVDYKKLHSGHLLGKCWRVQRNKSDIWSMPILLPEAKAIIEKYGSIEKLPRYDASDLNKDLKHLAHCAGIAKDLQHPLRISDFRETFASMLENEFMLEPRIVQVMIGHTNPRQIQSYSRLMPERILYELDQWKRRTGMIALEVQA